MNESARAAPSASSAPLGPAAPQGAGPVTGPLSGRLHRFDGPTWFSREPALAASLAVDELAPARCTLQQLQTAAQRLQASFPGWLDGMPSLEHLAPAHAAGLLAMHWARGLCNAERGAIEEAGALPLPRGRVLVWLGFHRAEVSGAAMALGLELVRTAAAATPLEPAVWRQRCQALVEQSRLAHPGYVTRVLVLAARERGVPARPVLLGGELLTPGRRRNTWQFGWGARSRVFYEASPDDESGTAISLSRQKALCSRLLRDAGLPVPVERSVNSLDEALAAARALGWPVVLKPADLGLGRGVSTGIADEAALRVAFEQARALSRQPLLVQQQVAGDDHRLLLVRGRLVCAARREPPMVTGDGQRSIGALVAALNDHRAAQPARARYLRRVAREPVIDAFLAKQGLQWESVPEAGRRVRLRGNANVSTGGEAFDVTAQLHPLVRALAEQVAALVGLEVIGLDYLAHGVDRAPAEAGGVILEVNHTPGLDVHLSDGVRTEGELGAIVLGIAEPGDEGPAALPAVGPERPGEERTGATSEVRGSAARAGPGSIPVVVVVDDAAEARAALAQALHAAALPGHGLGLVDGGTASLEGLPLAAAASAGEQAARLLAHPRCRRLLVLVDSATVARSGCPVTAAKLALWNDDNRGSVAVLAWDTLAACSERLLHSPDASGTAGRDVCVNGPSPAARWLEQPVIQAVCDTLGLPLPECAAPSPAGPAASDGLDAAAEPAAGDGLDAAAAPAPADANLGASLDAMPRLPVWRPRDAGLRPLNTTRPDGRPRDAGGLALFVQVRNEGPLLPAFLAHYRALGVQSFHLLDDASEDGSRELLLAEPDCTLWASDVAFRTRLANGMQRLHQARNEVPARLAAATGGRRWVLVVDADEFLFVPAPFEGLLGPAGLLAALERHGAQQALAAMVDLYPRRLADLVPGSPYGMGLAAPWWFDPEPGFTRAADGRPRKQPGGVRWRLQQLLRQHHPERHAAIYEGQDYLGPALWKTPIVQAGSGLCFRDSHNTSAWPPQGLQLALAHLKLNPQLARRAAEDRLRRAYHHGGIEHRLLAAALELLDQHELVHAGSVRFDGAASLQQAGLMHAGTPFVGVE